MKRNEWLLPVAIGLVVMVTGVLAISYIGSDYIKLSTSTDIIDQGESADLLVLYIFGIFFMIFALYLALKLFVKGRRGIKG